MGGDAGNGQASTDRGSTRNDVNFRKDLLSPRTKQMFSSLEHELKDDKPQEQEQRGKFLREIEKFVNEEKKLKNLIESKATFKNESLKEYRESKANYKNNIKKIINNLKSYPDLYKLAEKNDNLMRKIRKYETLTSDNNPEIQRRMEDSHNKTSDEYITLKKEIEGLKETIEILKGNSKASREALQEIENDRGGDSERREGEPPSREISLSQSPKEKLSPITKFFNKIKNLFWRLLGRNDKRREHSDATGRSPLLETSERSTPSETPKRPTTKLKGALNFLKKFFRGIAKYSGLLRWMRTTEHRYSKNWKKSLGVDLGLLAAGLFIGPIGTIVHQAYVTGKYNHKDKMHEKYSITGGTVPSTKNLVYEAGEVKHEFSVPDNAKAGELSFLTRHPIPNDQYKTNKQNYKKMKGEMKEKNLTKDEVRILLSSGEEMREARNAITVRTGWKIVDTSSTTPSPPTGQP